MKKIPDERIENLQEYLNERWDIATTFNRSEDMTFYNGITAAVEKLGLYWERKADGTHFIYGNM